MNQKTKWQQRQIGDVCEATRGTSITKKEVVDGKYPVIAGGQTPAYFHNQFNREGKTITISGSGAYAGFTAYHKTPIFASDCTTLQIPKEDNLLTKFLFLSLKSRQADIYKMQTGAAQPHVYCRDIAKMEIAFPPLAEQKRIVQILERQLETVEKARIAAEKRLSEANALSAAILRAALTPSKSQKWKSVKIEEICQFINGLWVGKKPPFQTIKVIRSTNFSASGKINLDNVAIIPVETRVLPDKLLQSGDIIIENSGGGENQPVGRVVYFDINDEDMYSFGSFTSRIRANTQIVNSRMLFYMLLNFYRIGGTISLEHRTSGIRNLNRNGYKQSKVLLPPLTEQRRITDLLDHQLEMVEKTQAAVAAELNEIRALPAALLRMALSVSPPPRRRHAAET